MPMKTNGNMPAAPLLLDTRTTLSGGTAANDYFEGLTKREMFCLHMGVAETGDAELDEIIRKGNRLRLISHIASGFASDSQIAVSKVIPLAVEVTDKILTEMEHQNE